MEKKLKSIVVNLDSGPHEVKKLPMGKYSELLQKLDSAPDLLGAITQLDTNDTGKMLVAIRDLLVRSWNDLVGVVSAITGVPEEVLINEVGLDEAVDLVVAAIEVNNLTAIKDKFQKLFSRKTEQG